MRFDLVREKSFYRHVAVLMVLLILQMLLSISVDTLSTMMLGTVSQVNMTIVTQANQVSWIVRVIMIGFSGGTAVLAAQYWGKGDRRAVERVMGLSLRITVGIGLLFTLAALAAPDLLMRIFTTDIALISEGEKYLRAVAASYLLGGFCTVYLSVMRSVERVRMSALVHCSAVGMNVVLNACFIFGWAFFPKLGITGVALATSITRLIETAICLLDSQRCRLIRLRARDLIARGGELMRDFMRYAVPAAANDIIWGLAFSVYAIILGHLSSNIVAANSVATVVRNLGTVVCFGMSSSAAIILGKAMGENRLDEARVYATRFCYLSVITALAGGAVILTCRPLVLKFMYLYVTVTDVVRSELSTMLYINSYYILGSSVNTMLICGIFRAGGDVKFGLVCDTLAMWGYAVPVGLLCAFVFKIPEMWVFFVLCLDEFVKMPVIIYHYKQRKWLRNITRENIAA